jgi:hypothetical protein
LGSGEPTIRTLVITVHELFLDHRENDDG